jgi:mycothiol synthase
VRRDIDDALVDWLEDAGIRRLRSFDDGLPLGLYRYEVHESNEDVIALMERHGYAAVRYFTENLRDLSLPIAECPLPDGIVARPWSTQAGADARGVHNAAFADHWGSQPLDADAWTSYTSTSEYFEAGTSWVAFDGPVAVAYVTSGTYPHDFEDRGRTESWIQGVGTLQSHRGRGTASALITMAMQGYRDDGMEFACLGVDSENATGANRIYERLGFIPEKRSVTLKKVVEPSD